jgi:hypothetical protein
MIRVYPRNEFVQTFLIKTYPERLLLPPAGKAEGQSGGLLFRLTSIGHPPELQGSNIFDGFSNN